MIEAFPLPVDEAEVIPEKVWPSLKGLGLKTKVVTLKPTLDTWRVFWKKALKTSIVAADTETTGLHAFHGDEIIGVSAAFFDGKKIIAGYWNFRHRGHKPHAWCQMDHAKNKISTARKKCKNCQRDDKTKGCKGYKEKVKALPVSAFKRMNPVFERIIISGINFKFDCRMLSREDVDVPRRVLDPMLIAHLFNATKRSYRLEVLAEEMGAEKLGDSIEKYAEEHAINMYDDDDDSPPTGHAEIAFDVEQPYAVMDVVLTLQRLQWERERWLALDDPRLMASFQIENACIPAFAQMEINGYKLDMPYVKEGVRTLTAEIKVLEDIIYEQAGTKRKPKKFDIQSGQELWNVLQDKGHEPLAFGKNGVPSTDADILENYGTPLTMSVIKFRKKAKILSTYLGAFLKTHATKAGFLHADNFIQGTRTGRPSQREPNLANQPRVDEDAPPDSVEVRRCFVPRTGRVLVFFDYSQMEMKGLFDYIRDKALIAAANAGADSHAATAKSVFIDCPEDEQSPKFKAFRQRAKTVNFGIVYGQGMAALAGGLGVAVDECMRAIRLALTLYNGGEWLGKWSYDLYHEHVDATAEELQGFAEDWRTNWAAHHWDGLRRVQSKVSQVINIKALDAEAFNHDIDQKLKLSARVILADYHEKIPGIKPMIKKIKKALASRGFIFNRFGRRYHINVDKAYIGLNYLIQGTCADAMKRAMYRVHEILRGFNSLIVNAVYDDLQIDMDPKDLHLIPLIREAMETNPEFDVNLTVDVEYTLDSWADKKTFTTIKQIKQDLIDDSKKKKAKPLRTSKGVADNKSLARSPKKSPRTLQQSQSKRVQTLGRKRH